MTAEEIRDIFAMAPKPAGMTRTIYVNHRQDINALSPRRWRKMVTGGYRKIVRVQVRTDDGRTVILRGLLWRGHDPEQVRQTAENFTRRLADRLSVAG